jgi:hypothetical protein
MAESDILPEDLRAEIDKFDAAANETIQSIGRALDAREPPSSTITRTMQGSGASLKAANYGSLISSI